MIIYGRNVLDEVLKAKYPVKRIYLKAENRTQEISRIEENIREYGYPFSYVSKKRLAELCGEEKNQGVAIDLSFSYSDLDEINAKLVVLLDHIIDPHNLGAIIRTSAAAGAGAVVITTNRSAQITSAVVRVSAGTVFRIPIVRVTNLSRSIDRLKSLGYWIYGADTRGKNVFDSSFISPTAVVFGNEGKGLSRLVKEKCDELISIPMKSGVDSLNVSVSSGIILFEVCRKTTL